MDFFVDHFTTQISEKYSTAIYQVRFYHMTNLINFTGEAGQKPSGLFAVISSLLYIIYVVRRMTLCATTLPTELVKPNSSCVTIGH